MKNKLHYAIFFGIFLSIFSLFSCGGGAGGDVVVTFNLYNSTKKISIPAGQSISTIPTYAMPSTSKSFNYFMYWSNSKADKASAVDFGNDTPIYQDTTLYAIYTPKLHPTENAIKDITKNKIEIQLYDDGVYPLNDGSYAGLQILHCTDGVNYVDYNLNIPSSYRDQSGYRYLTYELNLPLGPHYFKVTNGHETYTKYITVLDTRAVNFYGADGTLKKTIDIEVGHKLSSLTSSSIPSTYLSADNYFMYWSKSKSSKSTATEFDLDTPITENTNLYAIYAPRLASSNSISKLLSREIVVKLSTTEVYPLEDGSYAGLKILYSTDGINYEDYNLSVPSSSEDVGGYRYLKYNLSLQVGTHYFKVTNKFNDTTTNYQEDEKSVDITVPAENAKIVRFLNVDDTEYKVFEIASGSSIQSTAIPSGVSKSFNYFMYWSNSKASRATATEFNFSTPITEDITFYPIYTPKLSSITSLLADTMVVKLLDDSVYPLDDGSYAGLVFTYSTDNNTYNAFDLNIPSSFEDISSYRYLTYNFPTLAEGTYYFKVTNGHETITKNIVLAPPTPATNLATQTNDSYVKVSFTPVEGYPSYTVSVYSTGTTPLASKTVTTSENTGYAEFFGLDNGTEYTFKVVTGSSDQTAEVKASPQIVKKETDWVLAMYMDGDNNLHQPIYIDMNEVEYGLYQIRNTDGSASSGYDSVNVVALWDGVASYKQTNSDGTETTVTPKIGNAGTYLYELGTDTGCTTTYTTSTGCVLSSNTKNLSYTADWLVQKTVSTTQPTSYGELNMGDKQTLINYLNWVKAHYTATKGIILQFSNHGGGPRNATYVETADGTQLEFGNNEVRRALCWDDTSTDSFLSTNDVSTALSSAGFGTTNKLGMILMDVCLGSSLEDAYQFKDYAQYLAASPNNIPGNGLDYIKFMKSFAKDTTLDAIGKQIVTDYKTQYHTSARWDYYAQQSFGTTYYSLLESPQKQALEWHGHLGITTFTITDLSKISAVKDAIDSLCDVLLSTEGKAKKVKLQDNGVISPTTTTSEADYVKYLVRYANAEMIFGLNTSTTKKYYVNDSIFYQGSFTWLYDIGYIADMMKYCSASTLNGSTNVNKWPELYTAADAVTSALSQAIKYSWRDSGIVSSSYNYDFYHSLDNSANDYQHYFGLSISGAQFATTAEGLAQGKAPDFYKTALAFGADSKWYDLLKYWFGE